MLTIHRSACFIVVSFSLFVVTAAAVRAADEPMPQDDQEAQLIAVLQSDASAADKALTCKELAIHGSAAAVPELAKLLPDPQLSSWARIALEAIPGSESDAALRSAAESLDGRLLTGMINSLGVRRDEHAVNLLTHRLSDEDLETAAAAAVALGHIGTEAASETLQAALNADRMPVRSAAAEGCVLCAERSQAQGDTEAATRLYDLVRAADVPKQRIVEATRGAILARGGDGIPLLMEQFASTDSTMFQLALSTAREFPGSEIDTALAQELARTTPDRAALIIQAMADRPDTVVLESVLAAADESARPVRLSAINALQRIGDESCLSVLLDAALESDKDIADGAQNTLAELPGDRVDARVLARVSDAQGDLYPLLLELIGRRRIAAVPELMKALNHSESKVREAALTALGETVALAQLDVLITQVIAPRRSEDSEVAQRALRTASVRMPDRDACATTLASAVNQAPAGVRTFLLETLAEVGGSAALQALGDAAISRDPEQQDAASRLLGRWNGVEAAPVLLALAQNAPEEKYRLRAIRGYIGLARKFDMPAQQRVEMCRKALKLSDRPDEKRLVLDVVRIHPSQPGFRLASELSEIQELRDEASAVVLSIAQALGGQGEDISKLLRTAQLARVDLEVVGAEYGAGDTKADVTAILQKQAADVPIILLPSTNYNASFGGDPAPGVPKQLTVRYRINGKSGSARFKENELIILPMPE